MWLFRFKLIKIKLNLKFLGHTGRISSAPQPSEFLLDDAALERSHGYACQIIFCVQKRSGSRA